MSSSRSKRKMSTASGKTFRQAASPLMSRMGARVLGEKFFYAIYTRNVPEVTRLLDKGVDPNLHNHEYGAAPLHMLAERDDFLLGFRLLQARKIDLDSKTNHGYTALHLTCLMNCRKFAVMLMANGANLEAPDRFGKTALHMAVENGYYGIVLKLIQSGAEVNVMDVFENTPLSLSVLTENRNLFARTLLKHGADTRLEDRRSLHIFFEAVLACRSIHQIDTIVVLLDSGVDVNLTEKSSGRICLHFVAVTGYLDLAVVLVGRGACIDAVDARHRTPARSATEHQNDVLADYFRKGYRPPNLLKSLPLVYLWVNKLKAKIDERRHQKELQEALFLAQREKHHHK